MRIQLRIPRVLLEEMRVDLSRPHAFADERIGVLYSRFTYASARDLLVLGHHYVAIPDNQYVEDRSFGAVIGSEAFRDILQHLHDHPVGAFHIHMHPGRGVPRPSRPDLTETAVFVPDFFHGRRSVPHGAIILTVDSLSGRIWLDEGRAPLKIDEIRIVGSPLQRIRGAA